jgi:hypothetical protein
VRERTQSDLLLSEAWAVVNTSYGLFHREPYVWARQKVRAIERSSRQCLERALLNCAKATIFVNQARERGKLLGEVVDTAREERVRMALERAAAAARLVAEQEEAKKAKKKTKKKAKKKSRKKVREEEEEAKASEEAAREEAAQDLELLIRMADDLDVAHDKAMLQVLLVVQAAPCVISGKGDEDSANEDKEKDMGEDEEEEEEERKEGGKKKVAGKDGLWADLDLLEVQYNQKMSEFEERALSSSEEGEFKTTSLLLFRVTVCCYSSIIVHTRIMYFHIFHTFNQLFSYFFPHPPLLPSSPCSPWPCLFRLVQSSTLTARRRGKASLPYAPPKYIEQSLLERRPRKPLKESSTTVMTSSRCYVSLFVAVWW